MADNDLQEYMENVGLSQFTTHLTQCSGVSSLRELAESPMTDEFIAEYLGMSDENLRDFSKMRSTVREILGVSAIPSDSPPASHHERALSQPPPPLPSLASEPRGSRVFSLDEELNNSSQTNTSTSTSTSSSDFVDLRQPLRVTLDSKLKVTNVEPGGQLLRSAIGQRVVRIGPRTVNTMPEFVDAIETLKVHGEFAKRQSQRCGGRYLAHSSRL